MFGLAISSFKDISFHDKHLIYISCRYIFGSVGQDDLVAFYRYADVALVTPLRDGMNLVAKEFVASQDDNDPGVLILSPFAGAGGIIFSLKVASNLHQSRSHTSTIIILFRSNARGTYG